VVSPKDAVVWGHLLPAPITYDAFLSHYTVEKFRSIRWKFFVLSGHGRIIVLPFTLGLHFV